MLPFMPSNKQSFGRTGVIDRVEINDAEIDETAPRKQVTPVRAVACETGSIEAEHALTSSVQSPAASFSNP
jgi:hypothetical protein